MSKCCCNSLGVIRISFLFFGILTMMLIGYAHIYSPYTKKALLPDHTKYFTVWEYIHGYHGQVVETSTTADESTTQSQTEKETGGPAPAPPPDKVGSGSAPVPSPDKVGSGSDPAPPPDKVGSGSAPVPSPDKVGSGSDPAPPPDKVGSGPDSAQPPDKVGSGPDPAPPPDKVGSGSAPVPSPDKVGSGSDPAPPPDKVGSGPDPAPSLENPIGGPTDDKDEMEGKNGPPIKRRKRTNINDEGTLGENDNDDGSTGEGLTQETSNANNSTPNENKEDLVAPASETEDSPESSESYQEYGDDLSPEEETEENPISENVDSTENNPDNSPNKVDSPKNSDRPNEVQSKDSEPIPNSNSTAPGNTKNSNSTANSTAVSLTNSTEIESNSSTLHARSKSDSTSLPEEAQHRVTGDAMKVIDLLPKTLQNGYEACRSFHDFLEELVGRLDRLGRKTELKTELIQDEYLDGLVEYCPNILYERYFLEVAVACVLLSTICLSMSLLCCKAELASLLNRYIDAIYHFLCGLALLVSAGATSIFLYRMEVLCISHSLVLQKQFHEGLMDYQMQWHKSPDEKVLHIQYDKERAEKLIEINENLVPKYYGFLRVLRSHTFDKASVIPGSKSVPKEAMKKGKSKKKRKFSWTKRERGLSDSEHGSDKNKDWSYGEGTLVCEIYMKFYWKIGAVITGTIAGIFYIAAAIAIFRGKEQPQQAYVIATEAGNVTGNTPPTVQNKAPAKMVDENNNNLR